MDDQQELIEVRALLYGPRGLFPHVTHAELRRILGRPIRRKLRSGCMLNFYPLDKAERVRAKVEEELRRGKSVELKSLLS